MKKKNQLAKTFTKSESLLYIKKKLGNKIIPEFLFFTKKNFKNKKNYFLKKINQKFKKCSKS